MSSTTDTLPVHPVDLEPFRLGSDADRRRVATDLDVACRDSGFLQIAGHGVAQQLCTDVLDAFADFFDLPAVEKQRWVVADESANRGYSEPGKEGLAYSQGDETLPDIFEAFNVGRDDATGDYYDRHRSFFAPNVWPERPVHLQTAWHRYETAVAGVQDVLLRAMALALELPEQWLVERNRRAIVTTRAINYERALGAVDTDAGQVRMGAHTDYGVVTILLADDVPGLQVHRQGRWWDVPTPPGTFTCNIGDMLQRWTGDRWSSTMHRVVPPPARPGNARRRSLARFLDCPPDLVVQTIPSCVARGAVDHEPVVAGQWLMTKVLGSRTRTSTRLEDA